MLSLPLKLVAAKSRVITFLANLSAFKALIAFLLLYLSGTILWISCDDIGTEPNLSEIQLLGFEDKFALRMVIEDPYLYVCAGSDGVWRRNIREISAWEYLGLRDTTLGKYSNVGALDIDVLGQDILVAYNGSTSKIPQPLPPSKIVSIWRSTNIGVPWVRSDIGIPESINDSLEYNTITSLQRSPHQAEITIAYIDPTSYRSTDGGYTWTMIFGIRGVIPGFGSVRWHQFRYGEVWFFGESALFAPYCFARSDYGAVPKVSVNFNSLGFPSDAAATDIAFDAGNPDVVHVATSYGIISTSDGGYTWQKNLIRPPDNGFIKRMVNHPSISGLIYMAGGKRIYRTQAKCGVFTVNLIGEVENGFITSLSYDLQLNHLFIGTTEGGIYVLKLNGR